jgi:membrane dipeptidase
MQELSEHARTLHQDAIVIDAHSDILMAVADGRVRLAERTPTDGITTRDVRGHYDLPRWKEGGVTTQVCALFIRHTEIHYALTRGIDMVAGAYHEIAENEDLVLVTNAAEIRAAKRDGKTGIMLSFEGVDPLGNNLKLLPVFYQLGVRMASLTHARRNYFSGGVMRGEIGEDGGLTPIGRESIKMMNELGIVVDVRHMDARAINQVLDISTQPVIFSHVNALEAFPNDPEDGPYFPFTKDTGIDRQKMLHDIAATGGLACIIFWRQKSIDAIVDNMVHVAEQVGPEHLGLGTDFYGFDMVAEGMEDVSRFPYLTERLIQRGFSDQDIQGILGGNLMRVFERVLK